MTASDALDKFNPRAVRFFFLETHYRSEIDFSEENIRNAEQSLERIDNFIYANKDAKSNPEIKKIVEKYKKKFIETMDEDFETPKAIASIFEMIKEVNKEGTGKEAYDFLVEIDSVLGILKTKEEKIISERNVVLFKPSKEFKDYVNQIKDE